MTITFKKRSNPHGWTLRNKNKYYSNNGQLFNTSSGGNCVWYAYGRFHEVWGEADADIKKKYPWKGFFSANGCGMVAAAKRKGFKTGSTPAPGAIVSWSGPSSAGHVAFVESVKKNSKGVVTSCVVSQSSWSSGDMKDATLYKSSGWRGGYGKCLGFAYNPIPFDGGVGNADSTTTITIPTGHAYGTYGTREFDLDTKLNHTGNPYGFPSNTNQGKVQQKWINAGAKHDSKGFCKLSGRYLIACTTTFGSVGDNIDFYISNGDVLKCVMVDAKSQSDPGCNKWGHNNGKNILEFCGKNSIGDNPYITLGLVGLHVTKAVNYSSGGDDTGDDEEETIGIDMTKRISKLSSSDNYQFITVERESSSQDTAIDNVAKQLTSNMRDLFDSIKNISSNPSEYTIPADSLVAGLISTSKSLPITPTIVKSQASLSIGQNTVEAPFIELNIGGISIGSYNGTLDEYPNYLNGLKVEKQNGVINQYTINLVHQIRAGDDPNILDEVLSTVNYDKITIKYGDLNSSTYFKDCEAIITNVTMSRDYSGMRVNYTIEATSEGQLVKTYTTNFSETTDKGSNVIRNLLYNSGEVSEILQSAFPGMSNETFVSSNNLIPSDDSVVTFDAQTNCDPITYINYIVGCMSNQSSGDEIIRDSTYYITYNDPDDTCQDGAYFKITEVKANINPFGKTDKIYDITVGFNDDIVYDFSVDSTENWELLYENNGSNVEYYYSISDDGAIDKTYSPTLNSSSNFMSEINKNWWTQMVQFPISATLVLKGLLKPVMLMDYININVVFYGQKHIASGIYAITGQTDELNGNGYRTTLSLVKVSDG